MEFRLGCPIAQSGPDFVSQQLPPPRGACPRDSAAGSRRPTGSRTDARTRRTCCRPAPTTSFTSRNAISRLTRPATHSRISATVAAVSVQKNEKNAAHPFGSPTSPRASRAPTNRHARRGADRGPRAAARAENQWHDEGSGCEDGMAGPIRGRGVVG
jgi:hypothetical protein